MPANESTQGYAILILNQRFKGRLVLALSCLGYFLAWLAESNRLSAGLQSFLVPPAYAAILFFVLYAFTWINHPSDQLIQTLASITAGLVVLHLTGCLVINHFRLEFAAMLVGTVIAVNLYLKRLVEAIVFNSVLVAISGFALLLRDKILQQVHGVVLESQNYYSVTPMGFWLNVFISSLLMLLYRAYRKRPEENPEIEMTRAATHSLDDNPIAALYIDSSSGLISNCNTAAVHFFDGYSKDDLIGKNLHHFQKEPWTEAERRNIQRTLGRKGEIAVNVEFLSLKDRLLYAAWIIHSLTSDGKKIFYVTVTALLSHPKMEPAAAAQRPAPVVQDESRLGLIIENSDYAIVSVDRNQVIQVVNSKLAEGLFVLTGVRVIAGFNLGELIPSGFSQKYNDVFQKALRGISSVLEEHLELSAGKSIDIEINVNPLYAASGLVTGVSFFGRNITTRKRNEMELVHAREQALAEVRAKSAFLATMSHEIRTPLNGVIGMSKLLEHTSLTAKQKEYVSSLVLSGEALLSVINDILDYSKMESSKMELEHKPFAIKRCIEETFDLLAAKASEKKLQLHFTIQRTVPTFIYGDITRLRQVLLNLVSNAIKFTEKGKIDIHVSVEQLQSSQRLQFEVKDTGIGIAPNKIDKLFQLYSQVEGDTAKKYGGTGLGLAISKNLVELMKGKVWVTSKQGSGSSFYFTIEAEKADSNELILGNTHAAKQLVNAQALIISDEKNEYLFFAEYFTRWGMKTVCTDNAQELQRLLQGNESYQVLAIDAKMVSAHPKTLAEKARAIRPEAELSIVLFNADDKEHLSFDYTSEVISAVIPAALDRSKILNILLGIFSEDSLRGKHESQLQKLDKNFAAAIPLSLLVAEDNVISQKLAVAIFEGLGYAIDLADDGKQAIERIRQKHYDMVFMDVQMPEMDGFEATRFILNNMNLADKPVIIAMTAFALEGDREKCLEAGMSDYISKPFLIEEIVDKITKWGKGKGKMEAGQKFATVKAGPVSSLLDQNVITRLQELNEKVEKGFFNEVVTMFLKQAPALINEMIIYCNDKRYDKMGQAAHKLKGSALNIGAKAMAEICRDIEIKGRNNDGTDCSLTLERLRAVFLESEKELKILASV